MPARLATPDDAEAVLDVITAGFLEDPVWSWAFPDADRREAHYRVWWPMFIEASMARGATWVSDGVSAAAVWVPPGGSEFLPEDELRVGPLLRDLLGEHQAELVVELNEGFPAHHPDRRFHYLSLLATHPDHRGRGEGMRLLAECLAKLDAGEDPSLLESTNPRNHKRYETLGFERIDEWHAPAGGPTVAVMWRDSRLTR